jgi:ABC-2 type transport system ATP-binding protein
MSTTAAGSEMSPPAVEIEGLGHRYGNRQALSGVTFSIAPGEIFGLLGPNGSGKTTLFKILATLLPPAEGRARALGYDLSGAPRPIRKRLGVVFQHPSLDPKLTVLENLIHHGHLHGLRGGSLKNRAHALLDRFGLAERARDRVENLSGGLTRRAELAKALLSQPELLLLDEPSTGLDPGARREFSAYLGRLRREKAVTAFLTTHLMEEAEGCDRVGILDQGRLVALGAPDELKRRVGGGVVVIRGRDPEQLRAKLRDKLGREAALVDGSLRVAETGGHEFAREVVEAFPEEVTAVTFGKPTLEDVFIHLTGHRLWSGGGGVS